jgi:putative ABC transport system substrate-binding protein
LFVSQRQPIAQLALQHRLPMMGEGRRFAEAGALVSYAPSAGAMVRHAASFVDRIFKGARPGELPFERPTTFELVLNRRTAQTLGLALPRQWLLRADEVIG